MVFEKKHEIDDIFIIVAVCIAAIILGIIGIYALYKSYEAFISYIGVIFLIYSTISLIYTFLNKSSYDISEYNLNLGLDIIAIIISLLLTIIFGVKSFYSYYNRANHSSYGYH